MDLLSEISLIAANSQSFHEFRVALLKKAVVEQELARFNQSLPESGSTPFSTLPEELELLQTTLSNLQTTGEPRDAKRT